MGISEFLKRYGILYLPGIVFLALNSFLQSKIPVALGDAIDILSSEVPDKSLLFKAAGTIALLGAAVFAARFLWRLFIIGNARRMEIFLREKLYIKLQQLPLSFFRNVSSGDLMAYAINDVGAVRMTFGPVLAMGFNSIVVALLSIIGMIGEVELTMTLLALAPVPLAIASTAILGSKVQKRSLKVQKLFAGLSGFVNESITGIKVIKSFGRESAREERFNSVSSDMKDANVALADVSAMINPLVTAAFGLSYAIALIFGGNAVIDGRIGAGTLVTFLGYLVLVQQPVVSIGNIINRIQRGLASYRRLKEIFNEPSIPETERRFIKDIDEGFEPSVTATGLRFHYPDAEDISRDALSDISFEIKAGGRLGITGPTGSGKTTLLTVISKLRGVERGMLKIGDVDICDFPAMQLRSYMGYVPQDGFLFSASVSDNISFGSAEDPERISSCAELACIKDEIEAFTDGFKTEVGERGTHLSGGQKQRVSLARALYREPRILLLDDTLSAVDNITERRLISNLGLDDTGGKSDTTVIVVSHRLSVLEHCDEILFIDGGRITERGTHEELLKLDGEYAAVYRKQTEERECDE